MQKFVLEADELLPGIFFDKETRKFKVFGRSCPVNAFEFYEPIFTWLDAYLKEPLEETKVEFFLNYINTASSKMILKLFNKLEELILLGKNVYISWFYTEDDDMLETGEEFENVLDLKFDFIEVDDERQMLDL